MRFQELCVAIALAAWNPSSASAVADDCARALLDRLEAGRPADERHMALLPWFTRRPGLESRVEKVLLAHGPVKVRAPLPEDVAAFVARLAFKLLDAGRMESRDASMFREVAESSGTVGATVLRGGMDRGAVLVVSVAWQGLRGNLQDQAEIRARLGGEIGAVRRSMLEALYSGDKDRIQAAGITHGWLGLGGDFELVDAFLAERKQGLNAYVLNTAFLQEIGPEKEGRLPRQDSDRDQAKHLLDAGLVFLGRDPQVAEAAPFFEQAVPKAGPGAIKTLDRIARYEGLRPIVARLLLDATGEEWGWHEPRQAAGAYETHPGPFLWTKSGAGLGCWDPALRPDMPARVLDPREAIAASAVAVAGKDGATDALAKALGSPHASVRGAALRALAAVPEKGPGAVRAFAGRADLTAADRSHVLHALHAMERDAAADLCAGLLATRTDAGGGAWPRDRRVAPARGAARALVEAIGEGEAAYRDAALKVLTESNDRRRVEVFRKVLTGDEPDQRVWLVVTTVAEQYLIELGPETLRHLRSPNKGIRDQATAAVERLKFYAEAKKAFENK